MTRSLKLAGAAFFVAFGIFYFATEQRPTTHVWRSVMRPTDYCDVFSRGEPLESIGSLSQAFIEGAFGLAVAGSTGGSPNSIAATRHTLPGDWNDQFISVAQIDIRDLTRGEIRNNLHCLAIEGQVGFLQSANRWQRALGLIGFTNSIDSIMVQDEEMTSPAVLFRVSLTSDAGYLLLQPEYVNLDAGVFSPCANGAEIIIQVSTAATNYSSEIADFTLVVRATISETEISLSPSFPFALPLQTDNESDGINTEAHDTLFLQLLLRGAVQCV